MSETPVHFTPTFEFTSKGIAKTCVQDSPEDILACVFRLLECEEGFREDLPEFGRPQLEFQTVPMELGPLEETIVRWEPRATPEIVEQAFEASNQSSRLLRVEVSP